jgi:hypothetical protein
MVICFDREGEREYGAHRAAADMEFTQGSLSPKLLYEFLPKVTV